MNEAFQDAPSDHGSNVSDEAASPDGSATSEVYVPVHAGQYEVSHSDTSHAPVAIASEPNQLGRGGSGQTSHRSHQNGDMRPLQRKAQSGRGIT